MSGSNLRRLMELIEESQGGLSLQDLARELDVSPGRVEGLVDFWVRKGRIQKSSFEADCTSCGKNQECLLVLDLPGVYELVESEDPDHWNRSQPCIP